MKRVFFYNLLRESLRSCVVTTLCFVLTSIFTIGICQAKEYDVGGGDNDYPTINSLTASVTLSGSDIVNIYPGTYTDGWILSNATGTESNPVLIRGVDASGVPISRPQETVIFDYKNVTHSDPIVIVSSSAWVELSGLCFRNMPYVNAASNVMQIRSTGTTTIKHCLWKDNVATFTTKESAETVVIDSNEFSGGFGYHPPYNFHMVYTLGAENLYFQNNYFHDYDSQYGYTVKARDVNVHFLYNFIELGSSNGVDRDGYEFGSDPQHTTVVGNIFKKSAPQSGWKFAAIKRWGANEGDMKVINNTFIDDNGGISRFLAFKGVGGAYELEVSNNIFTGVSVNIADLGEGDSEIDGKNNFVITGADITGTTAMFKNTLVQADDPKFLSDGDYRLTELSPNVNSGSTEVSVTPTWQYPNFPRVVVGLAIDIGAFEYLLTAPIIVGIEIK